MSLGHFLVTIFVVNSAFSGWAPKAYALHDSRRDGDGEEPDEDKLAYQRRHFGQSIIGYLRWGTNPDTFSDHDYVSLGGQPIFELSVTEFRNLLIDPHQEPEFYTNFRPLEWGSPPESIVEQTLDRFHKSLALEYSGWDFFRLNAVSYMMADLLILKKLKMFMEERSRARAIGDRNYDNLGKALDQVFARISGEIADTLKGARDSDRKRMFRS